MSTTMTPVVQTELGRLVERREALTGQINQLKRDIREASK